MPHVFTDPYDPYFPLVIVRGQDFNRPFYVPYDLTGATLEFSICGDPAWTQPGPIGSTSAFLKFFNEPHFAPGSPFFTVTNAAAGEFTIFIPGAAVSGISMWTADIVLGSYSYAIDATLAAGLGPPGIIRLKCGGLMVRSSGNGW